MKYYLYAVDAPPSERAPRGYPPALIKQLCILSAESCGEIVVSLKCRRTSGRKSAFFLCKEHFPVKRHRTYRAERGCIDYLEDAASLTARSLAEFERRKHKPDRGKPRRAQSYRRSLRRSNRRGRLRGAYKRKVGKAPGDHIRYSTARRIAYDEIRIGCLRKSVERAAQLFRLHLLH